MTKAILFLSNELESELAPEEGALGSGYLVCSGCEQRSDQVVWEGITLTCWHQLLS